MADEAVALVIGLGAVLILSLAGWLDPRRPRRGAPRGGPERHRWEPCWDEEIARHGRLSYGRYRCVHDDLMELDARAARQDFPIPQIYE
jgi:hypothetical protein